MELDLLALGGFDHIARNPNHFVVGAVFEAVVHLLSDEFVVFALHESALESHVEVPLRVIKVKGVVLE